MNTNIYLDIDGVLLVHENKASDFADEFLKAVLRKYPNTTYWLTTHCWQGINRTNAILAPLLKPETVKLLHIIKPTRWDQLKTDAIDFTKPFLWFDDDLYSKEKEILINNNALKNWVNVNLANNPAQLYELTEKYFS